MDWLHQLSHSIDLWKLGILWADFHDFLIWGFAGLITLIVHRGHHKHKLKIKDLEGAVRELEILHGKIDELKRDVEALWEKYHDLDKRDIHLEKEFKHLMDRLRSL
jgi:predicted nuclease with TOPRIM domain